MWCLVEPRVSMPLGSTPFPVCIPEPVVQPVALKLWCSYTPEDNSWCFSHLFFSATSTPNRSLEHKKNLNKIGSLPLQSVSTFMFPSRWNLSIVDNPWTIGLCPPQGKTLDTTYLTILQSNEVAMNFTEQIYAPKGMPHLVFNASSIRCPLDVVSG